MERRKWPWKRKSSDKSPGETESSGSMSSYSERFSDEQDAAKSSPNHETQSPEVSSKAICKEEDIDDDLPKQEEINDSVKSLSERLSAALVNVKAKEDLVKQHAKVAEEAIAGWEKAENEVTHLKQQLGTTVQQKSALEDRVSHLDGALKECVRQLRQAREEQEQKIHDAVEEKTRDWQSTKVDLERQLLALQSIADTAKCESPKVDPSLGKMLELLKRENAALRHELHAQYRELETRTIERDLSTQTAETASKQHLESIKKMAKLEAECRRLKFMSCKPSFVDHKSIAASTISIESLTDTQSDNGEQLSAVDIDIRTERNKGEPSCSHPRASTLLAELNQLGNEKAVSSNLPSSLELDLMDDFLEMERLASLPETDTGKSRQESEAFPRSTAEENALRTELEALRHERSLMEKKLGEMEEAKIELEEKLKQMEVEKDELEERLEMMEIERDEANQMLAKMETKQYELGQKLVKMEEEKVEMGEKLMKLETQKDELETALSRSQNSVEISQFQLKETQMKLEKLQNELTIADESKLRIESQLISMEAESLTMSAKVEMLETDIQKERASAMALTVKCQVLEEELSRLKQDEKISQSEISKNELKIKQEDLAVAAGKLAECQKTIASLGNQLKSLAALEDFLIDTTHLPEFTASESLNITIDGEEQCIPVEIIRGPLVDEVRQQFSPWVYQVVRLYKDKDHAEFEFTVGPIPVDDSVGKEVITRLTTNMVTNKTFYTDSNGRDFLKRVRDYRQDWNLSVNEPQAGNYYPLNLGIYTTDKKTELSVLVDRATGAASIKDGQLELMLHRRTLFDDSRGVGEPLDELVCANDQCQGLTVRGNYYVNINQLGSGARWRRKTGQEIYSPLLLAFAHDKRESWIASKVTKSTPMDPVYSLPLNVALITLQELNDGSVLLRLAHLYEAEEDPEYSKLAKVELKRMFLKKSIKEVKEMSLSANQLKSEMKKKVWKVEGDGKTEATPVRGGPIDQSALVVELGPMEIRTFLLKF